MLRMDALVRPDLGGRYAVPGNHRRGVSRWSS